MAGKIIKVTSSATNKWLADQTAKAEAKLAVQETAENPRIEEYTNKKGQNVSVLKFGYYRQIDQSMMAWLDANQKELHAILTALRIKNKSK